MQQLINIYKSIQSLHRSAAALALVAVMVLGACELPQADNSAQHGTLRVTIASEDGLQSLTLLPDQSMVPASYRIRGSGPLDASFETTTAGGAVDVHDLRAGEWQLEVSAFNSEGLEIGYGGQSVNVEAATVSQVAISVRPLSGSGSLSLSALWPAAEVQSPAITAGLTIRGGQTQALEFSVDAAAGTADYHNAEINAGYYTLALQLTDGGTVVAGAVETVRIVRNGHTEGQFSFDDLNHPTGNIDIIVSPDMDEPLDVQIEGAAAMVVYGESQSATAAVANADGAELEYAWYLNGGHVGDGASVVLDSALALGSYRLDLVVFTADGSRSGSASHSFRVE